MFKYIVDSCIFWNVRDCVFGCVLEVFSRFVVVSSIGFVALY